MPHQPSPETPLITTFLHLALPMMINYLLIFYIMFECICNAFAELTRFADREFYQDWWNATSMDVFSRKWNKPVHSFLLKHVYASSIAGWGISRKLAMFLTFLLSSLLHELVMAIVSGKVRGYLFLMQMAQLPLIVLGQVSRTPKEKENPRKGVRRKRRSGKKDSLISLCSASFFAFSKITDTFYQKKRNPW